MATNITDQGIPANNKYTFMNINDHKKDEMPQMPHDFDQINNSLKIKSFRNICGICEFQQTKQPKQNLAEETNDIYNH